MSGRSAVVGPANDGTDYLYKQLLTKLGLKQEDYEADDNSKAKIIDLGATIAHQKLIAAMNTTLKSYKVTTLSPNDFNDFGSAVDAEIKKELLI